MLVKSRGFSARELDRFRDLQRMSFSILEQTAAQLSVGDTEREIARGLVKRYRAAGAGGFFHLPVVLFGARAGLPGDWPVGKFFPKRMALAEGDSVILDAAPIFDGYLVDTSLSCSFGPSAAHRKMMLHLSQYRSMVCEEVNAGTSFREIARRVERVMASEGYEAVHVKHPGAVLGHRAVRTINLPWRPRLRGFDAISLSWFKAKDALAMRGFGDRSPLWNTLRASDHPPHDGLWLVEPHVGKDGLGAKWEEILVVAEGQAHWLEDRPPHVRQWEALRAQVKAPR